MAEHKVEGGNMLLFIDSNGGTDYDIVVCLTSVSKADSITVVDASSACGPDKSPGTLELSYAFEGQHLQDPDSGSISGTDLRILLRGEQTIGWKIAPEAPVTGDEIESGTGFLSELSSTYSFDSVGTFTGSIQPYGNPTLSIYNSSTPSVNIGGYNWMTKNLSVTTYANGDAIPEVSDPTAWAALTTGAWCYYNNDPSTEPVYGRLYNWFAVADIRGLKPDNEYGWVVPVEAAFNYLFTTVSNDGGALKEAGTAHWLAPNTGATNSSGFTAVPGGVRQANGTFGGSGESIGEASEYWVAGTAGGTDARSEGIYYNENGTYYNIFNQNAGLSVRCFWD
jgi:uncharacterized protein (TIGR02145 family)